MNPDQILENSNVSFYVILTIGARRPRLWWPDSTNRVSGKAGAVQSYKKTLIARPLSSAIAITYFEM